LRAVFDTNVLISAFVFPGGAPESAYRAALSGRVTLVTSPPLLAGLARVLADRFGWEKAMVETPVRQVARIGRLSRHHRVGRPSPLRARVVGRDPDHPRHSTSTIPGMPTSAHTPR
jgi:predicted nucleic acid-binding protein